VFDSHFARYSFNMGNDNSAPARPVNKLSKPKTNSWGNLVSPKLGSHSRHNSQSNVLRYSVTAGEAVVDEAAEQEDPAGIRRMLRPESSQGEISPLDMNGDDVGGDYFDSLDRSSMSNSQVLEVEEDRLIPIHRYSLSTKR
jgi:hypothetical protein